MAWMAVVMLGLPALIVYFIQIEWRSGYAIPVSIAAAVAAAFAGGSLLAYFLNMTDPVFSKETAGPPPNDELLHFVGCGHIV
jgi:hypothetical protein